MHEFVESPEKWGDFCWHWNADENACCGWSKADHAMRDCDIEFGDHEHDDFECTRILKDMNPEMPDERFWDVDEFGQPVYGTD